MKQFNKSIIGAFLIWLILAGLSAVWIGSRETTGQDKGYLVEINRIQDLLVRQKSFSEIDLSDYSYIEQVDYYPVYQDSKEVSTLEDNQLTDHGLSIESTAPVEINDFFKGKAVTELELEAVPKTCEYYIMPLVPDTGLMGYIRYSYAEKQDNTALQLMFWVEIILGVAFTIIIGFLLYIRGAILSPFHEIRELPYELSKGHLNKELKESKNRYFGKFLWGLNLLRQSLEEHKRKELQLEKDKKLMILSISHDIKTPLSTIKLYSKALYDNLYTTEEKRKETAKRIEEKADQIENFVVEIMKTSSTELFEFDIKMGEFYLTSLLDTIRSAYSEKLELLKTEFKIGPCNNKLLRGDIDKLTDVFDNLIQNAIKYGDGKKINITFEEEDNCQLIRVTNTGTPISKVNLHHMFESFWRGDNATGKQGNGLGLYICKQLMRKMEGEIFAETLEDGMSFVIVLKKG